MCRSRRELSNAYLLAKFGFDTAENEPYKVCTISRDATTPAQSRFSDAWPKKGPGLRTMSKALGTGACQNKKNGYLKMDI